MPYDDYVANTELVEKVNDDERLFVNLGLKILTFNRTWLEEHPDVEKFVEHMRVQCEENPVRFFLPHCARHPDFNTPSHNFINDNTHIYSAIQKANRYGGSTLAWVKMLVRYGVIPCEPEWEIFTEHGVKFQPWTGPKEVAVVSYMWDNHRKTLWPQVMRKWTPKKEISNYLLWNVPKITSGETIEMTCGSKVHLMACSQPQGVFESQALDAVWWDEQPPEEKFDGSNARLKTRRKYRRGDDGYEYLTRGVHLASLTPHKLEDRPDTGAGTFIHQLAKGEINKGMTVKFYRGNMLKDVPDWVYTERQKRVDKQELAEAIEIKDKKRERHLMSRLFGEWEESGGLVYDEWDREMHVIDDFELPWNVCAFRCGDHGRVNPEAWLWVAMLDMMEYIAFVVFREYESVGKTISEDVAEIVRLSGNRLALTGKRQYGQQLVTEYKEEFLHERYVTSVLDGRTFRSPDKNTRITLGELYQIAGLRTLRQAPITDIKPTLSFLKELLKVDPTIHRLVVDEHGKPRLSRQMGAPRFYVMRSCAGFIREIENYRNKPQKRMDGNQSEKPQTVRDHRMDAIRYGLMSQPRYDITKSIRDMTREEANEKFRKRRRYWCPEDRPVRPRERHLLRDGYTGY